MKKWGTIGQAGSQLALECKENGIGINCVQANIICKEIFKSIANAGWDYTRKNMYSVIKSGNAVISREKTVVVIEVLKTWFDGFRYFDIIFRSKAYQASVLIKRYKL